MTTNDDYLDGTLLTAPAIAVLAWQLPPAARDVFSALAERPTIEIEDTLQLLLMDDLAALHGHGVIALDHRTRTRRDITLTAVGAAVASYFATHPVPVCQPLSSSAFRRFIEDAEANITD